MSVARLLPVLLVAADLAVGQTRYEHPHHLLGLDGVTAGDAFGFALDAVGDLDRDGHPDFAAGAYRADPAGRTDAGQVTVYSGRTGAVLRRFDGAVTGEGFGFAVRGAGDLDGDGAPELLVGAFGDPKLGAKRGSLTVVSLRTSKVLRVVRGNKAGDLFGCALANAGDLDADGRPDYAVGALRDGRRFTDGGSVTLFSGRTGKLLRTWWGDGTGDQFGVAVASAGDADGDRVPDLLVGAWKDDRGARDTGSVTVFSGKTGKLLHLVPGSKTDDNFGNAVAAAGDVDGDGRCDFVAGALSASRPWRHMGSARVISGRTGRPIWSWTGAKWGDFFGVAVAGIGDADRDGRPDVAVGAFGENAGGQSAGSVRVLSGRTGKLLVKFGGGAHDELGVAVAAAGDVDRDDWPDLLVGSQTGRTKAGQVQVLTVHAQQLRGSRCCLDLTAGGRQDLLVQAGAAPGSRLYVIAGSASGTRPGLRVGGVSIPLNRDAYHVLLLAAPNAWIAGSVGMLDGRGEARAHFVLPRGLPVGLRGLRLHHAALVFDARGLELASNAFPLVLQ